MTYKTIAGPLISRSSETLGEDSLEFMRRLRSDLRRIALADSVRPFILDTARLETASVFGHVFLVADWRRCLALRFSVACARTAGWGVQGGSRESVEAGSVLLRAFWVVFNSSRRSG